MKIWSKMTIGEIISKYYVKLQSKCNCDRVVIKSKTECDILQDVCIRAFKKYKDNDIEESEGYEYLSTTLSSEKFFQRKRKNMEIITYMDNLEELGV